MLEPSLPRPLDGLLQRSANTSARDGQQARLAPRHFFTLPKRPAPSRASAEHHPIAPNRRQLPVVGAAVRLDAIPPEAAGLGAPAARKRHLPVLAGSPAQSGRLEGRVSALHWLQRATRRPSKKRPGSGLPPRAWIVRLLWLRRLCQVACLGLFWWLLVQTTFRGSFERESTDAVRLAWPVEGFLLADPWVAVMTLLSTHAIYRGLAWSLAIVVVTVLVGRAFCGWVCPFGTLHHFTAWLLPSRYGRAKKRVEANRTRAWQDAKYYLLWAFLGAAVVGSAIGGLLDPLCILVRALGLGVLPVTHYVLTRLFDGAESSNWQFLQTASDRARDFLAERVWTSGQAYYHESWLIFFLFVGVLFVNRFIPRFWCRVLCPLGALLGLLSRFSLVGMTKKHEKCTDCNLCLVHCQGADSPQGGVKHRQDECHLCLNCEAACPEDVIKFSFLPNRQGTRLAPDLQRRGVLAGAAAGAVSIPGMRIGNWPDAAYSEKVIRPPGAVEEREFLERCIRCAECMKVCPNNALHPAYFEAGLEGLWTPILVPRVGYCEFSCVLCGQVCPTGAIQKINEAQKMGLDQAPVRLGTAMYDHGRCLPWSMATPCIVCEEFCPTSPKAIWVETVTVPKRSPEPRSNGGPPEMQAVEVQRPHVDPSLCVGCGACEKACPVVDKPAVYVTSAGESRSKTNVILLENTNYNRI